MKTICHCNYCVEHSMKHDAHIPQTHEQMQTEFEATCFMYEFVDAALKFAVEAYNNNQPLTNTQKQILAKAIWRL